MGAVRLRLDKVRIVRPKEPQGPKIPAAPRTDFDMRRHYHELVCGHLTDLDRDAAYRDQTSPRNKLFCEECGKWKLPKAQPKRPQLPREPLF